MLLWIPYILPCIDSVSSPSSHQEGSKVLADILEHLEMLHSSIIAYIGDDVAAYLPCD